MKTRVTLLVCAVLALSLLAACSQTTAQSADAATGSAGSAYQKITAADGNALLDGGEALTLVDVRRADWTYDTVSGAAPREYFGAGSEGDTVSAGLVNIVKCVMDVGGACTILRNQIFTHPTMVEAANHLFSISV